MGTDFKKRKNIWAILTLFMILIALFFGLKPKGWSNNVQWLPNKSTIHFQKSGIAYVDNLRAVFSNRQTSNFTIELVVTPGSFQNRDSGPLLVINDGDDSQQLVVWQYGSSLIVMNGDDYDNSRRWPRVVAQDSFSSHLTYYITIISSEQGTQLFVNGSLVSTNSNWKLSIPKEGNQLWLVLGNSVYGNHGWTGDFYGLVISGKAISTKVVSFRFNRWITGHDFDYIKKDSPLLVFTFNQKKGNQFSSQSQYEQILEIPPKIISLKNQVLSLPRKHWLRTYAAIGDMILNTVGFIPLGAVLYGFLQSYSGLFRSHKKLITVTLCMMLSFGIELGQAWIPTRDSSLMDFLLNTFGAWLGVELWNLARNNGIQLPKTKNPI
jgi:VanZ family protein